VFVVGGDKVEANAIELKQIYSFTKRKSRPTKEDLDNTKNIGSLFELIPIVQHIEGDHACQTLGFGNKSPSTANM
jgi:hypothetical protein